MLYFVQTTEDGIVFSLLESPEEIPGENIIRVDENDLSLLGKKYNKVTKSFEDVPVVPSPPPINQQQEALDAIMSGMMESSTMSADANDAIMNALIDIQIQIDGLKTGGTV